MEEMLKSNLYDGEEILWRGHAEAFETLDKTHKGNFITKALIGAAIAVAFLVFMLTAAGITGKTVGLVLAVLLLCEIPALNILSDGTKLRKIEYAVTTERMIVLRDAVKSVRFSEVHEGAFLEDRDGHVSLVVGRDAMKAKPYKRREICVVGASATETGGACESFCFYAPTDRKSLQIILHEKVPTVF